jgi:hypothetical protein
MTSDSYTGDPEITATRPANLSLEAGDKADVTITFSPMDVKAFSGRITISSNAKNAPTAAITVQGLGKQP